MVELLGELARRMPVGLVVWQLDEDERTLRLTSANAAAEALTNLPLGASVGRGLLELFPSMPRERALLYVQVARGRAGDPAVVKLEDVEGPGTTFSVRLVALPERSVGVVFQDLAEQTAELAKREERFRLLLRNSADGILLTNADGQHFFATESVTRLLGVSPDELTGPDGFSLIHPDDLPRAHAVFAEVLASPNQQFTQQLRARHADGSWKTLELVTANRLAEPHLRAIVSNFRDVSERKSVEDTLRRTEEQLLQAQKLEAVGRLAGGIAHDFNNLLSVVLSYTELLQDTPAMSAGFSELQEIRRAGQRAAELTRQLLAFSRQQVLEPKVVDLGEAVRNSEPMIQRIVGEDIELRFAFAPMLWKTRVDPGQLEQVLMNLVVNARDAMAHGGVLTIETANTVLDQAYADQHAGVSAGEHVMLAVSDTGTGMDATTRARIFDPFFTTKEVGKGTGLGLATVFGIVKQSSGSIYVYSELGTGSSFKIYLPRTDKAAVDGRSTPPSERKRGTEAILLVEDDASVRSVARAILEAHGYRVTVASSGFEALTIAARSGAIDLLVTDVVMPKMSGRELARRLGVERPRLKILYMSGYTDNAVFQRGMLETGAAFLQKPLTPENLTSSVRAALDA